MTGSPAIFLAPQLAAAACNSYVPGTAAGVADITQTLGLPTCLNEGLARRIAGLAGGSPSLALSLFCDLAPVRGGAPLPGELPSLAEVQSTGEERTCTAGGLAFGYYLIPRKMVWEGLLAREKFAIAIDGKIVVIHDAFPHLSAEEQDRVSRYLAVREYGRLVLGNERAAICLEMAVAEREGQLDWYIEFLNESNAGQFIRLLKEHLLPMLRRKGPRLRIDGPKIALDDRGVRSRDAAIRLARSFSWPALYEGNFKDQLDKPEAVLDAELAELARDAPIHDLANPFLTLAKRAAIDAARGAVAEKKGITGVIRAAGEAFLNGVTEYVIEVEQWRTGPSGKEYNDVIGRLIDRERREILVELANLKDPVADPSASAGEEFFLGNDGPAILATARAKWKVAEELEAWPIPWERPDGGVEWYGKCRDGLLLTGLPAPWRGKPEAEAAVIREALARGNLPKLIGEAENHICSAVRAERDAFIEQYPLAAGYADDIRGMVIAYHLAHPEALATVGSVRGAVTALQILAEMLPAAQPDHPWVDLLQQPSLITVEYLVSATLLDLLTPGSDPPPAEDLVTSSPYDPLITALDTWPTKQETNEAKRLKAFVATWETTGRGRFLDYLAAKVREGVQAHIEASPRVPDDPFHIAYFSHRVRRQYLEWLTEAGLASGRLFLASTPTDPASMQDKEAASLLLAAAELDHEGLFGARAALICLGSDPGTSPLRNELCADLNARMEGWIETTIRNLHRRNSWQAYEAPLFFLGKPGMKGFQAFWPDAERILALKDRDPDLLGFLDQSATNGVRTKFRKLAEAIERLQQENAILSKAEENLRRSFRHSSAATTEGWVAVCAGRLLLHLQSDGVEGLIRSDPEWYGVIVERAVRIFANADSTIFDPAVAHDVEGLPWGEWFRWTTLDPEAALTSLLPQSEAAGQATVEDIVMDKILINLDPELRRRLAEKATAGYTDFTTHGKTFARLVRIAVGLRSRDPSLATLFEDFRGHLDQDGVLDAFLGVKLLPEAFLLLPRSPIGVDIRGGCWHAPGTEKQRREWDWALGWLQQKLDGTEQERRAALLFLSRAPLLKHYKNLMDLTARLAAIATGDPSLSVRELAVAVLKRIR